jgi:hypothetical protein
MVMSSTVSPRAIPPVDTRRREISWPDLGLDALQAAIVHTVAYGDVFDYPLTLDEIHRYLVGVPASPDAVQACLAGKRLIPRYLSLSGSHVTLRGREAISQTRQRRAEACAGMWPRAVRYAAALAHFPFVRMVAVTGALCMGNTEADSDIDYFIVTEPDRLWLCRAAIIGLVRLAARTGNELCPNYLLSERALVLQEHNLFMAHEFVQMIPLVGHETYLRMWQLNAWVSDFLPNAYERAGRMPACPLSPHPIRSLVEVPLRTPAGGWLERWEMSRKIDKLGRNKNGNGDGHGSASFCSDWCKGHFLDHGQRTLDAFTERLQKLAET